MNSLLLIGYNDTVILYIISLIFNAVPFIVIFLGGIIFLGVFLSVFLGGFISVDGIIVIKASHFSVCVNSVVKCVKLAVVITSNVIKYFNDAQ